MTLTEINILDFKSQGCAFRVKKSIQHNLTDRNDISGSSSKLENCSALVKVCTLQMPSSLFSSLRINIILLPPVKVLNFTCLHNILCSKMDEIGISFSSKVME